MLGVRPVVSDCTLLEPWPIRFKVEALGLDLLLLVGRVEGFGD